MTSRARLLMFLLCAVCVARIVPASFVKPFWHDELFTIMMTRLPSPHAMWAAGIDGVDLSPPLNLWMTRAVHAAFGVGHVQTRLPPLFGFCLMVVVVFTLVWRRAGTAAALTAALLPFVTAGLRFASEARPYGVMMGLSALSLYCWMESARGGHRRRNLALLAISVAASIWNHYFGVLVLAPIAAGECVRMARGRLDRGVVVAVVAGAVAALPLYPLIAASSAQRSTFWSRATLHDVPETYAFLLNAIWSVPALAIAAVILAVLASTAWLRREAVPEIRMLPSYEIAALAAAVAVPLLGVVMARVATGVFVPRYALAAVPGSSAAIALLLWRLNARRSAAETILCAALIYIVVLDSATALARARDGAIDPLAGRALLVDSLHGSTPTVVSSSLQFVQFWYYLPSALKPRLHYLADPACALNRTGSDTIDRGYLALSRWTAIPVDPFKAFVDQHPTFRVYQAGSGWLMDELQARGALVEEVDHEAAGRLFQVTMRRQ